MLRPTKPVKEVYPRVCGGTLVRYLTTYEATGLSPRVRGNLLFHLASTRSMRSIPACAGEPRRNQ